MTGCKVPADECLRIGLCEKVVPRGEARQTAEETAHEIARFHGFRRRPCAPIAAQFIGSMECLRAPSWGRSGKN
jgi:enoyl-CoA hydratase/carnithine racemase